MNHASCRALRGHTSRTELCVERGACIVVPVATGTVCRRRDGVCRLGPFPRTVQWLSDNGPKYTAEDARAFGRDSGFDVRTTPAYSPESNGMAESFVKRVLGAP